MILIALAVMINHSIWLFSAQSEWHKRARVFMRRQARVVKRLLKTKDRSKQRYVYEEPLDWNPVVDIFISAKNESRVIENTIHNLFKLDYDQYSVWIIDDCSTDDMPLILSRLQEQYPHLRVVNREFGSCPGKSAALNDALPLSKGDVICVFDADAYVEPDFLKQVVPYLAPEHVGAVQVQKKIFEQQTALLPRLQDCEYALDTYFQVGRDLIGGAVELRGNGELIKRSTLIDVNGWNNRAITDDLDLSMRLLVNHWDIRFCPDSVVWEEGVPTVKGLLRQRRRWAEGSIRRYLDYIFPLNSPTRLSLVERIDTLVFTVYFIVPALVTLELIANVLRFVSGVPTYGSFLALAYTGLLWVSQVNLFISVRVYRNMPFWEALVKSVLGTLYIYLHWVPVIVVSFGQIMFGRQVSTWHRTEHIGDSAKVS